MVCWIEDAPHPRASLHRRQRETRPPTPGPAWSPDGRRIAFERDGDHPSAEIYVMNANGTHQHRLTGNPSVNGPPAWSPDGQRIAFDSNRQGNYGNAENGLVRADAGDSNPGPHHYEGLRVQVLGCESAYRAGIEVSQPTSNARASHSRATLVRPRISAVSPSVAADSGAYGFGDTELFSVVVRRAVDEAESARALLVLVSRRGLLSPIGSER